MSFPCATPRELQGVRRCAAAGRAGGWQLRTEGWLNLEGTPDSGRHFKMSVSPSSTAPPASRAFCSSSSAAVASHAPSSTAPKSADSPAGRSLDDGFRSPTAGSASSLRLLSSPARPQCESVSLFAAVRRQQHKAMRSRHMAVIIGRQHPVLRRQLSSNLSWPAPFPAAMVVGKLSRTSRNLFMMTDQRCGFLVPLAFLLRPWTRLEGTSSNRAYLIYNSVDSLVRANTRARFCSSIKSMLMRHSLCLVTAAIRRVEVNSMQATTCT